MDTKKVIAPMKKLIQADFDAIHVYNRVIGQIPDDVFLSQLTTFRDHHVKHINVLTHEIQLLRDKAPKFNKDLMGHLLETAIALFTTASIKGAMTTLRKMEEKTNEIYGRAVSLDFSPTLKENLRTFFSDKKTHLDYINENLKVL